MFQGEKFLFKISLHIVVVKSQHSTASVTGDVLTRKVTREAKAKEKQTHWRKGHKITWHRENVMLNFPCPALKYKCYSIIPVLCVRRHNGGCGLWSEAACVWTLYGSPHSIENLRKKILPSVSHNLPIYKMAKIRAQHL